MNAIAYVRRSKESTEKTVSLDVQLEAIKRYGTTIGCTGLTVIEHDGISGGNRDRFEDIHRACTDTGSKIVIVYHLDRFARDTEALLNQVRQLAKKGVDVHVVGRGRIDLTTSSGLLMNTVEAAIAEHYRAIISEKTTHALAHLKAQGRRYSGEAPYGYAFVQKGAAGRTYTDFVPAEEEQRIMCKARQLREQGLSLRHIAQRLNEEGYLARSGRPFAPSTLAGILKRQEVPCAVGR